LIQRLPKWVEFGAFLLALVAGYINVIGLLGFDHQSVSHLSGSATLLGARLSEGAFSPALHLMGVLLSFFIGALIAGALLHGTALKLGRHYQTALLIEAALLFLAYLSLSSYVTDGFRRTDKGEAFIVSSFFEKGLMKNEEYGVVSDKKAIYEDGNIEFLKFEDQGEVDIEYTSNSKGSGKRFKVEFLVKDDSLVSPPWLDAVPVDEYGAISGKVWAKYRDIWKLFDENDFDGYVEELGLVLDRVSYVTGYENRYQVAEQVFPNHSLISEGKSLVTLNDWERFYPDSIVSLSPDKKLIRIYPNPIRFYDETGDDNSAMSYYMCVMPDGEVEVCYQKDTGM
jgi:hypothetical protein